ncbi:MAG: menaquinone biosynthesis decarboxylase, partial [Epsilonproteobacteria bacterium]|nr:menaquinone biosynthesis decarboxylase [Campylobacterota bacterium]
NRISKDKILISEGVVDHLDHSSPKQFEGGKLGVDATGKEVEEGVEELLEDEVLLKKLKGVDPNILKLKQYKKETKNPIVVVEYKKEAPVPLLFKKLDSFKKHIKILIVVDEDSKNPYMLVWRVSNSIDAKRDVFLEPFIMVDATKKDKKIDNFPRVWPQEVFCSKEVLERLEKMELIELDREFLERFRI